MNKSADYVIFFSDTKYIGIHILFYQKQISRDDNCHPGGTDTRGCSGRKGP